MVLWFLLAVLSAAPALAQVRSQVCREMVLHNGKFATVDMLGTMASSVVIRGDRIDVVSTAAGVPPHSPCATVIDLGKRLVIPGLIDTHNHTSYFSARPGHDVRLDMAGSIAELQALVRARAAGVKPGEWITAYGGWSVAHLQEKRPPTSAELDAAAPRNPVLLFHPTPLPAGQGLTNSLARAWLAGKGIAVGDAGLLSEREGTSAINALRATMTFEDRKRAVFDLLAYFSSLGLTMQIDNAGAWPPNPELAHLVEAGDGGMQTLDPYTGYLPQVALEREGRLPGRLRVLLYSRDVTPQLPLLRARLDNQMMGFGSDWLRVSGVGERIAGSNAAVQGDSEWDAASKRPTPQYEAAARLVAARGWTLQQHSSALDDARRHVSLWEQVNASTPLAPLRWALAHVRGIDRPTVDRVKALGAGVTIIGSRYMSEGVAPGPAIRMIVESGVRASFGSDGPRQPPTNPWLHMYSIVTGRNYAGKLIEGDLTLSRMNALRLYTISGAWFSFDEDKLGSIEAGKLADLVVLNSDFLDSAQVPDEAIKKVQSVLTIVGGRIVYDAGVLGRR
jgi:predicted amidohydrolase YtcJ